MRASNSPAVRRQMAASRRDRPLSHSLTHEQAWAIIRAHKWGALYLPLKLNGHFVQQRRGPFGTLTRRWFVYDRRDWSLLAIGRILSESIQILEERGGLNRRRLPSPARAKLRTSGHAPLDESAYAEFYGIEGK